MIKTRIIFSILVLAMIAAPLTVNPIAADTSSGPVPIPGNLFPIPGTGAPIVPNLPNLGTVSILPPLGSLYSINKIQSGLVASDPLNNEIKTQQQLQANPENWKYYGDAIAENASYAFFKDTQGLHIGVQAPDGMFAGFYAESPVTNAMLFHSVITTPVSTLPVLPVPKFYENGMYIQTSQPTINYVTCTSNTSQWGTVWGVISVTGNSVQALNFNTLWFDQSPNQPLTRDCTIITNGSNYLKVYLDGTMVYTSNTLNLQMPAPFIAFLEPQTSYPGQMLYGTYKDYYSTTDETLKVTNNPSNAARVDVIDTSGTVIASSPVNAGTATISIGQYHFPMAANIKVYDSANTVIASTSSMVNIFGGDVYLYN